MGLWGCGGYLYWFPGQQMPRREFAGRRVLNEGRAGKAAWMASLGERACDTVTMKTFAELAGAAELGRSVRHPSIREMRKGAWLYLCLTSF